MLGNPQGSSDLFFGFWVLLFLQKGEITNLIVGSQFFLAPLKLTVSPKFYFSFYHICVQVYHLDFARAHTSTS